MKKRTPKSLKAELDRVFSIFIRQRGMDNEGNNTCVSCGAVKPWQDLQCGHWFGRRHLSTRWNEKNAHCQCGYCNVLLRGNMALYARYMYSKYTLQELDELDGLHRETVKLNRADLEAMIDKYRAFVADRRREAA